MKLIRVKTKDAKKCDLKPSQRIKVSGNVFVEVYKDNKGYFYTIDIPGATDFVSKERYPHPDKASLAGRTHAQKFMKKIRGDEKVGDYEANDIMRIAREVQKESLKYHKFLAQKRDELQKFQENLPEGDIEAFHKTIKPSWHAMWASLNDIAREIKEHFPTVL